LGFLHLSPLTMSEPRKNPDSSSFHRKARMSRNIHLSRKSCQVALGEGFQMGFLRRLQHKHWPVPREIF
jgi:hypothetical protein